MEHQLVGLASIIILGILSQWLSWRINLPAILLLLISGMIAGPFLGILKPDDLFGELLFPLVSVSVAIILFEGGLSLRLSELKNVGRVVRNLTTTGILITWTLGFLAAYLVANVAFWPALLLGAILVVSGPTVIIPLLRQIRPSRNVGSILKWEGMVNDPIGAILAVLVFEAIIAGGMQSKTSAIIFGVIQAAVGGTVIGILTAGILVLLLRRYLVPDFLQNPMALMLVVIAYVSANMIQSESGLLAVTIMGVALANQKYVSINHIVEFKESLRVILISSLFIILAAQITLEQLALFEPVHWVFVAILIIIVRPLAVLVSTRKSTLNWRERGFLAWMAPRGIVAAAVVSIFAVRLQELGFEGCGRLVPLTFQVIIGTVIVYGFSGSFVARSLKVAQPNPQGVLFVGAHSWIQEIAKVLQDADFRVTLIDTNWYNVSDARQKGIPAYYADVLSENLLTELQLDGIGRLLALTPNDEVNSLSALHFQDIFGRSEVYQLIPKGHFKSGRKKELARHLQGRFLFNERADFEFVLALFRDGAIAKKSLLTEEYDFDKFRERYGDEALPMFIIGPGGNLKVMTALEPPEPRPGDTIISIVKESQDIRTDA